MTKLLFLKHCEKTIIALISVQHIINRFYLRTFEDKIKIQYHIKHKSCKKYDIDF